MTTLSTSGVISTNLLAQELHSLDEEEFMTPSLFIGHGHPKNAVERTRYTETLSKVGASIKVPKAIIVISAHWLTKGTYVNGAAQPKMIYDYYGFPKEYYEVQYPAPGNPELAREVQQLIKKTEVGWDTEWGFDHGGFIALKSLFPKANIPTFELSIDYNKPFSYHYELAQELKELRKKGVLIIGSGNMTHNLSAINPDEKAQPNDWAMEFDETLKKLLDNHNHKEVININNNRLMNIAHPEPSHFLPLLYALGVSSENDVVTHPYMDWVHGSLSMRCVQFG
ncbi:MAG: 4,5-DOPA dioxygenase extradiol [Flavipsychrobacter sp.]